MIIWSGVYKNFTETGATQMGFHNPIWYTKQVSKAKQILDLLKTPHSSLNTTTEYPLEIAISMLLGEAKSVDVLDFGGGMGEYYFRTISKVPDPSSNIAFDVIESDKTLENLPVELRNHENLNFFSKLIDQKRYTLAHFGSVMQYIEEWTEFLQYVIESSKSEYLVFSDLLCGDIPTFVTKQKYYEEYIPVQFYNYDEFTEYLKILGYDLIYKSYLKTTILGKESLVDLSDLPQTHQLTYSMNLILKKRR